MSAEDFRINAFVRQVLLHLWVDTEALRFGAIGRIVYFHGRFDKLRAWDADADTDVRTRVRPEQLRENITLLKMVEKEIREEPTVTDIVFRLDNFRKVNGKWSVMEG